MQLSHLLLAQLVSSVILPISGLAQAGKNLSPAENAMTNSIGSISESLVTAAKGSNKLFEISITGLTQEHPGLNFGKSVARTGRKRPFNEIHTSEPVNDANTMINRGNPSLQPSPRHLPKLEKDFRTVPKAKLERQESFKTNFNEDFDTQGQVGACHVFATLEVIHEATKGLKLSKEKLFLDHLFSLNGMAQGSVDPILDLNMKEIQRVRKLKGSNRCADSIEWEGGKNEDLILGFFRSNFELLKTYGGVVVPNNANWKDINSIMQKIQNEQDKAVRRKTFNQEEHKESLRSIMNTLFERRAHLPEERDTRKMISDVLKGYKPEYFAFEDTKHSLLEDTYHLIKIIEKKGTAYLSVDSTRFYRAVGNGQKLTWRLRQGASSDHAVALVGYSVGKNVFYIKDSNTPRLIEMSPKDLFLSMQSGVVLVPKPPKVHAKL